MALSQVVIELSELQDYLDHYDSKIKFIMRLDGLKPTDSNDPGKILIVFES